MSTISDAYIERLNYINDPRTQGPAKIPTLYVEHDDGTSEEIELPTHWEVCPVCDGEGKHVNPSIDAGGINPADEDPEFLEDYMSGVYDVVCNHCGGRTTVREVDVDAMSPELRQAYEDDLRFEAEYEAERRAEFLLGC